jgi:hypothetical protein
MVCAADQAIREGKEADISCLTYKSHKNNRAGSSTLLVEANGLSEGLADAEWVASWIGLAKITSYDMRKRHEMNREIQITAVVRESDSDLKDLLAVTDAKSMYDNLTREQYTGAEKRAAVEICAIRDSLDSMIGISRWVPHEENPVGCMTKLKGNAVRMLEMFRTHRYRLVGEADELEHRRKYREATGMKNPRPSVQLLKSANSPTDKKGAGKGKGNYNGKPTYQPPWTSNTPTADGPGNDDEWLLIDPAPQAAQLCPPVRARS